RKIERFLSQPFHVAEQFTGTPGTYVPIAESIRGFKEILEGKHDDVPERAFLLKGTIDDVVADAGGAQKKDDDEENGGGDEENGGGDEENGGGDEGNGGGDEGGEE